MSKQWIVISPDKGNKIKLVSKGAEGLLPKGSFLTIIDGQNRPEFILRVEDSEIEYPYSPSPFIIDMNLDSMNAELKWQNHISARVIKDLKDKNKGLVNVINVLSKARRSNQEEIDLALVKKQFDGPKVFLATIHEGNCQILTDESEKFLIAKIPNDFIYHQVLVCGKTGSGKTVSTKYLAQYFVENEHGAVLAINVKDVDFLKMDKASDQIDDNIQKEWKFLNEQAHGIKNYKVYYPATTRIKPTKGVSQNIIKPISLDVKTIEPEALNGILLTMSDIAAQYLPDIFRFWREDVGKNNPNLKFNDFVNWFTNVTQRDRDNDRNVFQFKNIRGDYGVVPLASGTATNILRNLNVARAYFDDDKAIKLNGEMILERGMMSVIDLEDEYAKTFGSVLLRHLLHQIIELKSSKKSTVPILIIIDEVHQFYNTESSREALGDLDTICRQGRSQEIGVIFSSQNLSDIPGGLSNVINTKIFFKSDANAIKYHGISITDSEMQVLEKGFAVVNIYDSPNLKYIKFPLAYAGVIK